MERQSRDQRWSATPTIKPLLLGPKVIFGCLGMLNTVNFLVGMASTSASSHQRASALGLSVAANACCWLFAWQEGDFRKVGKVLLAFALVLLSFVVLHVGLQALQAHSLGVSLLDV